MTEASGGGGGRQQVGEIYYSVTLDTAKMIDGQREADRVVNKLETSLTSVAMATKTLVVQTQLEAAAQREAAAAAAAAAGAQDKLGASTKKATEQAQKQTISAKQTAAALRGVPAQVTDIVTSLQGGQNPLTVFLQQGGQLRDMFGGALPAAKALGGYLAGLVSVWTGLAAAAGLYFVALVKGDQEQQAFQRSVILTGGAAGKTAGQLNEMAAGMDSVAGITRGQAAEALTIFIDAGVRAGDGLRKFTEAAIQLERAGGPAVDATAKAFKDLEKSPTQAALKLNEATNFLTTSLYRQIKTLEDQGKTTEAARVAQEAYANAILDRTPRITENLGLIEKAWRGVKDIAREAWDAILNVGRTDTPDQVLAATRQRIADLQRTIEGGGFSTTGGGAATGRGIGLRELEAKKQELAALQEIVRPYEKGQRAAAAIADEDARRAAQVKALAEFDKAGEKFLEKRDRMEREITQARELGRQAGLSEVQIEERIAAIRKSYADKVTKFDAEGYLATLRQAQASEMDAIAVQEAEKLRVARQHLDEKKISEAQYVEAVTLIYAEGERERAEAMLKEQKRIDAERKRIDNENERASRSRQQGRDFANQVIAADDPVAQVRVQEEQRLATLEAYRQQDLANSRIYEDAKVALRKQSADRIAEIESRAAESALASTSNAFGQITNVLRDSVGEQDGVYKAMFTAQKAFAIASAAVNIHKGISDAAAQGKTWQEKLVAIASVTAATASILSNIRGVTYGGGRQYGGPVSAGSMYRVNEDGRPEMFTASNGSQYLLPTKSGQVSPAGDVGASRAGWTVIINNNAPQAQGSVTNIDERSKTVEIAVSEVANQISSNSGQVWSAMRTATNVQGRL